jgi:hypothetical protein
MASRSFSYPVTMNLYFIAPTLNSLVNGFVKCSSWPNKIDCDRSEISYPNVHLLSSVGRGIGFVRFFAPAVSRHPRMPNFWTYRGSLLHQTPLAPVAFLAGSSGIAGPATAGPATLL